jgi:hypothetical protein
MWDHFASAEFFIEQGWKEAAISAMHCVRFHMQEIRKNKRPIPKLKWPKLVV